MLHLFCALTLLAMASGQMPSPPKCVATTCVNGFQNGTLKLTCGGSGETLSNIMVRVYFSARGGPTPAQAASMAIEPVSTLNCSAGAVMSKETTDWFAAKTKETDSTTVAKGVYGRTKCVRGQASELKLDDLRNVAQCEKKESCSMEYDAMVTASTAQFILNATQCTDTADNILTYDFKATCKKGGIDPLSVLTLLFILTMCVQSWYHCYMPVAAEVGHAPFACTCTPFRRHRALEHL